MSDKSSPTNIKLCPQCGGERVKTFVRGVEGQRVFLAKKWLFGAPNQIYALACKNCGLVQLYAETPHDLDL